MLKLLLFQLPVPNNPATNVPLAAGYLAAYAQTQGLLAHVALEILPRTIADYAGDALLVDTIMARRPDVLGVSLYTWNSERSLAIIARVKARLPGLRVVVGGPEVQADNHWLLSHPAVNVAVIGEGEQTLCEVLRLWSEEHQPAELHSVALQAKDTNNPEHASCVTRLTSLDSIAGIAFRRGGELVFTPERVALANLALVPSPYLQGYLDVVPGGMLMVEVSRWCPYACSFCLYGRNMGPKLGSRYFGLERVLAEIAWGKARGVRAVHFIEANLNLVPLFWPLMRALADLNADRQLTFYAELRGEHLTDAVVAALDAANVRVVEVGLQTANPAALKASLRRTDLQKWAAGTRRLYQHGIEVFLDVILGLPADDAAGVATTLDFIRREDLGPYDIFTLQVLPGTAVRRQAAEFGLSFQEYPPYYVLQTDRLSYVELKQLRQRLKREAGLDPDTVEGLPEPRREALGAARSTQHAARSTQREEPAVIRRLLVTSDHRGLQDRDGAAESENQFGDTAWLRFDALALEAALIRQLASHVDLVVHADKRAALTPWLEAAIEANPSTVFDLYLVADEPPDPFELWRWRAALPYKPGYLDRVAVYRRERPDPEHQRVSPRIWLVLPWAAQANAENYAGCAEIVWCYDLALDEVPPLRAWYAAGGGGISVHFVPDCTASYRLTVREAVNQWAQETGRRIWFSD